MLFGSVLIGFWLGWELVLRGLGEEFQGFMSAELEFWLEVFLYATNFQGLKVA